MKRHNDGLDATLEELKLHGYVPVVTRDRHWKVKCPGLPPITISVTANDPMAVRHAKRTVRKIIAQNTR
jgi:hypothetical protein